MKRLDLTQMEVGEKGVIVSIIGGHGLVRKLRAMGVLEGKSIKRISSQPFRGPITVEIDNLQVAIGFGMAKRIIVEVKEGK